ncbi:hypothetical protein [Micromonospora sp. NBRC 101691]|uniref:hypothetical protein n=1 Tax=Micromonospora sp. NBRC 101691 TaxID=3032198 RepID=UPI0024A092B1|nr:hypothetical protein [Micromonospora sp. NBRC 101691]GLY24103.1 hypothetical protein Misp04_38350 [Micromonospora sp. NBRC 101691]
MSPGGTDASLLELVVGFFAAASLLAVITVILRRRRSDRQDLLGTQVREMEARAAAAASPDADTRLRDRATQIANARNHEAASRASAPQAAPAEATSDALTFDASAADTASLDAESPNVAARDQPAQDTTAPPDGWPSAPGGKNDAMADAFAWLRIAALVEAGQREQAVELLSTMMTISADEAEMLVDGLNDAGGERRPD